MFQRIFLGILAAAVLASGLASSTAAPARADHTSGHGDQRPCVSRHEYLDIRWQWPPATRARVIDHFDLYGYLDYGWGSYYQRDAQWAYRKCGEWGHGSVFVWFDNYSWGDRRPTHRVFAIKPSRRASWIPVQ